VRNLRLILPLLAALLPAALPAAASAARTPVPSPRIVNGHLPTQAWPAQTSVLFTTSSGQYVCGGTLVSARWVLTAAHCVTNDDNSVLAAGAFSLRVGGTTRSSGHPSAVDQVKRNPFYSPSALTNDLALLHLVSAAPQEPTRIVASGTAESALWAGGVQATVIGWGITETGSGSTNLVEAQVPMVSDGSCSSAWGTNFKSSSMVCAGGASIDTCGGDSGGPLMVPRNGSFTIVGVTSWGSNTCGTAGLPGVYARLGAPSLNSWVRSSVPTAAISVPAGTPAPGTQVALSTTVLAGAQATTPTLSWDLDNDGAFDDATGATPTATFATAGSHVVRVQAVYADNDRAVAREVVTVVDPNAALTPVTPPDPAPSTTTAPQATAPQNQQLQQILQQNVDLAAPIGSVSRPARIRLRTLRGRGLRVAFSCRRACTISANVTLNAATARRFGIGNGSRTMTIGRGTGSRDAAGKGTLSVRLSPRAKRALRSGKRFTIRLATALDGAGATPVKGSSRISVSR
jgi:V8-like Glu-specific endopeptidase